MRGGSKRTTTDTRTATARATTEDDVCTKTHVKQHLGKRLQDLEEKFNQESSLSPEPPQTTMFALVGEQDNMMNKVEQLSKWLQDFEGKA